MGVGQMISDFFSIRIDFYFLFCFVFKLGSLIIHFHFIFSLSEIADAVFMGRCTRPLRRQNT